MIQFVFGKVMPVYDKKHGALLTRRKVILVMKLITFLMFICAMQVCAHTYAQKLTIHKKNVSVEEIFNEIQRQTDYNFFYNDKWAKNFPKVSVSVTNGDIREALDQVFRNQPYSYSIVGTSVTITPHKEEKEPIQGDTLLSLIRGKILTQDGEPLAGATVTVKGSARQTATATNGEFSFDNIERNATLIISSVSYETQELNIKGSSFISIRLKAKVADMDNITISLATGYQNLPKERITGSFDQIDNKLLNRSVSTTLMDRLENLSPGLLFNKGDAANTDAFLIRGRSTIFADAQPLIVLDNFAYSGDINNINPNDIENVTILKDAAAASIWGARAANGVIIITTKRGKTSKPQVQLTTNITWQQKPDLYNVNRISSSDYIDLEKFLYEKDYYSSIINSINHAPITPVVELLIAKSNGNISAAEADAQIEAYKKYDIRDDLKKYAYRTSLNQQYAINVSGSAPNISYYMSLGYDRNLSSIMGEQYSRISLRTQNTYNLTKSIQIDAGISYIHGSDRSGNNIGYNFLSNKAYSYYPYTRLADDNGDALPFYGDYRKPWLDTAGAGKLLDWKFYPLEEISRRENKITTRDFLLTTGIRYTVADYLNFEVKYQYEDQLVTNNDLNTEQSYRARDYINNFTRIDWNTGSINYVVPKGGIMDSRIAEIISHQGRAQLNYNRQFSENHELTSIVGYEIRSMATTGNRSIYYGYNADNGTINNNIDYTTYYSLYSNKNNRQRVNNGLLISKLTDHFISYYANAAYTYRKKYTLSGSARIDQANLFGVKTNQKGTPLWSFGASWNIFKEGFYDVHWLPFMKLRATYGYNGNISRQTSAYTTLAFSTASLTPLPTAHIINPPNENLRWERVSVLNIGLDFNTKNNVLAGTIEYYRKNGKDLMGQAPVDPTYGIPDIDRPMFYGNIAGMKGSGIDLQLNSRIIDNRFKWHANFIFSRSASKVTQYLMPVSASGVVYLIPSAINPVIGRPLFAVNSLRWMGLDPANGNPLGYFEGKSSTDYSSIYSSTKLDSMVYHGSAQPVNFGAFRNTFAFSNFSLSFNISYKTGHYFKTNSVNYSGLISAWSGHSDYAKRWQKPGDETATHVPSFVFPSNSARDAFYSNSEVLIQKADNIRLEDITLSYELERKQSASLPFKAARFYVYTSQIGVIWKSNKYGIDPYYNNIPAERIRVSVGVNVTF